MPTQTSSWKKEIKTSIGPSSSWWKGSGPIIHGLAFDFRSIYNLGKSLLYHLQLSQKSDFAPSTTKPGIQPPRTIKTVYFTSLVSFTSGFYIFFIDFSLFFFHSIVISNMDKNHINWHSGREEYREHNFVTFWSWTQTKLKFETMKK